MSAFVRFIGTSETRGGTVRLSADGNDGFLEFLAADVTLEEGRILVREGAVSSAIQEPSRGDVRDRPPAESLREACPSGITCCIGAVHLCCDDFRVIGSCGGTWGCGRRPFIP